MFKRLDAGVAGDLAGLLRHIDAAFPLPARFAAALPKDIAALSRLFTSARSERRRSYLSRPPDRSAYLRYFLPWNVFRLCKLFAAFEKEAGGSNTAGGAFEPLAALPDGAVCVDLGSAALTVPLALWISFPALRRRALRFYCVDQSGQALDDGRALFAAYTGGRGAWELKTVKADVTRLAIPEKAAFVSAYNLYNELYEYVPEADSAALAAFAQKTARSLSRLLEDGGSLLVAEPGAPRAGQFLSRLRRALIGGAYTLRLPCTHQGHCAMRGGKKGAKWCHFAFGTEDAPAPLRGLSQTAGLAKERATISFLFAQKEEGNAPPVSRRPADSRAARARAFRTLSDPIALANGAYGVYACSEEGLALLYGSRRVCAGLAFGSLVCRPVPASKERDQKSGAVLVPM